MAHEISFASGRAEIAFVGDRSKIWHGLGQELTSGSSIETWTQEAGMNWDIRESDLIYSAQESEDSEAVPMIFEDKKVLYRSDTKDALSVVGKNYKIVQPKEVLEFFRDLVSDAGMELSTAGVLFGGRQFWALADAKQTVRFDNGDKIDGYLLLSTSCDGTLATSAQFTSVRVVCNNTLSVSLRESHTNEKHKTKVSTSHRSVFQPKNVKSQLGLYESAWDTFTKQMHALASKKVTAKDAYNHILALTAADRADPTKAEIRIVNDIHNLYLGAAMGSDLAGKTAYGLLNAITEYHDHHVGRNPNRQLQSQFWGTGNKNKNEAFSYICDQYEVA